MAGGEACVARDEVFILHECEAKVLQECGDYSYVRRGENVGR